IREFVPALVLLLLAVFGIYRSITTRHQEENA
ncbi:MAG: hypothetical protein RL418_839, partial [Actinomycetota bacterium]